MLSNRDLQPRQYLILWNLFWILVKKVENLIFVSWPDKEIEVIQKI